MDMVERTWEELGYRIRATGWKVWVRTLPHGRKFGGIWLPPKASSFHGDLPHLRTVYAMVLSAGPLGQAQELEPGDIIAFKRLEFAWFQKLTPTNVDEYGADEEFLGYIDANHICYKIEGSDGDRVAHSAWGAAAGAGAAVAAV